MRLEHGQKRNWKGWRAMNNQDVINFLNQVRKILLDDKSWLESTIQPINEAFDMAISALKEQTLPSAQPEPHWIPVSERLPEEDDYKSCMECLDGAVWYFTKNGTMGLGYYYKSTKEWSTTDDLKTDGKVVAWMPLPEPYRDGGEADEHTD